MWNAAGGGILWLAKGRRRLPAARNPGGRRRHGSDCPQRQRAATIFDVMLFDIIGPSGSVAINMFEYGQEYGVCDLVLRWMLELNIRARKTQVTL